MKVHLLLKNNYALFLLAFLLMNLINSNSYSQGVVVTEESGVVSPHSSSILDVRAVNKGLLIPRMTSVQRIAIASPENGLLVYDLNENQFFYYNSATTEWIKAVGPQCPQGFLEPGTAIGNTPYWNGSQWVLNSNNLFHNGNRVGIGTNNPLGKLDVRLADGTDYINVQRTVAGFGPIIDFFGYSNSHRLRLEYLSSSVYNFQTDGVTRHIAFNPSGNIGIGTGITAPTQNFDVVGNARLRALLFDFNNSSGTSGQVLTRGASGIVWANPAGNVSGTGTTGRMTYWSSASNIDALPFMNYNTASQFVEVTSKTVANDDDPIFEVRNKDGLIVFGVYQTGVRIYVDDSAVKTARGGFAVGGFTNQKDKAGIEYLKVTPDSVRVYVDVDDTKTARGGFAVGGFTNQKAMHDLLRITPDSARIYVKSGTGKTARGGFAVGGYTTGKEKGASDFMYLTPDNYFIGHESGINTIPGSGVSGRYNTFFGFNAGNKNKYGHSNVFIGNKSGFNTLGHSSILDQGSRNVFLGFESGFSNTTGYDNVYIGYNAGRGGFTTQRNVMVGKDAGYSATGNDNIIIGTGSGYSNTGANNIFLGNNAGKVNTGADNIIIGKDAAFKKTQGDRGVFIGNNAGYHQEVNNNSVFIGDFAGYGYDDGYSLTYPSTNICIGPSAGHLLGNSSSYNIFIGYEAGYNIKANNSGNIILGAWAGKSIGKTNSSDNYNVIIGYQKGISVEGFGNVFLGNGTYTTNTRNISNSVHIGNLAGDQETTSGKLYIANSNTTTPLIYGDFAAAALRINGSLTFNVGANSVQMPAVRGTSGQVLATNATTGVAYWTSLTGEATTASNGLNLSTRDVRLGGALTQNTTITQGAYNMTFNLSGTGDFDIQDNGVSAFFVRDDGNVGVSTTAPAQKLHVRNSVGDAVIRIEAVPATSYSSVEFFNGATYKAAIGVSHSEGHFFIYNGGNVAVKAGNLGVNNNSPSYRIHLLENSAAKPTSNTWTVPSDIRLKDVKGKYEKGLSEILLLEPIVYKYKANNALGIKESIADSYGFSAQAVQKIFPEAVSTDEKGFLDFDIHPILIAQINAIKELNMKIEELERYKAENEDFKARFERLERLILEK